MGFGLRKSPPELNATPTPVITKSPTNSVAAAASTLIYQKNYVDSNSGTLGGNGGTSELYDNALEVDSRESSEREMNLMQMAPRRMIVLFIWRIMNWMKPVAQR
jgi:hypothetical protein